jgi:hypothetical protein
MIKRVYGLLSGCHIEAGLVFLVRPEFLLDVGNAQGGQTQAIGLHQGAWLLLFLWGLCCACGFIVLV